MRTARIKETGGAHYHIMSRIIDRQMLLSNSDKARFVSVMRKVEGFCGIEILTHATLTNHWHALVYIPPPQPLSDEELIRRLGFLYPKPLVDNIARDLSDRREAGLDEAAEALKAKYTYRMYDLSEFAKTLKQRFTQSYNARHQRTGTLWNERFKSILVQGSEQALSAIAAYIDLNPLRAGLVGDPKDYRFSGYGEAVAGSRRARRGIRSVIRSLGRDGRWPQTAKQYRKLLYLAGEQRVEGAEERAHRPGFSAEEVQAVLDAGGELNTAQVLRCRVRYFTDGAVLGSRAYVEEVFGRHRSYFSAKRTTGARRMTGAAWGDLYTARRLRLNPIIVPG